MKNASNQSASGWKGIATVTAVLTLILLALFSRSFQSGMVHHSNDGPLGVLNSAALSLPEEFTGFWMDLYWLGANGGTAPVSITYLLLWVLGPVGFAKFYPPLALLILGLSAWTFFRTIGLRQGLAVVAAIAAALNSNFLSNTAWGLGTRSLTLAMAFLALAALSTQRAGHPWLNAALAGLCVGMGIIEGADNGAIFSVFIGAFVVWQAFAGEGSPAKKFLASARVVLVALCAAFIAAQVMITLVGIAKENVGGANEQADPEAAARDWQFATQWSLPPAETLRVLVAGLYGYRMDTPEGGNYWGRVGEAAAAPEAMPRSSGAGEYAGALTVVIALWALFASFNKSAGVFSAQERKLIWFWAVALLIAVLLSWGRHAPFYQLVYALPYFKTIRNPMKFMHPGHMAIMILFGYGLLGLGRRYLVASPVKAAAFEKRWMLLSFALAALGLLSFLVYSGSRGSLEKHLATIHLGQGSDPASVARFSVGEVGWAAFFLMLSVGAVYLIARGTFTGHRARWAAVILGLVLSVDLARAARPWIVYWDYQKKYATNPILDLLKAKPYEGRVVAPPGLGFAKGVQMGPLTQTFPQIYSYEWVQHHFQFYNIQSIDVSQDPRPPADKKAYMKSVTPDIGRYWELTNTRWILGLAGYLNALNTEIDKGRNRFRISASFDIGAKPGISSPRSFEDLTAVPNPNGPLALFENTGALPRAKLYSQWLVLTNSDDALKKLVDPAFDPAVAVVIADVIPAPSTDASNAAPATVEITGYAPKQIELKTSATVPTVLLVNDRYDPEWKVLVDGKPAALLRANVIMRGVRLSAGQHNVTFRFEPSLSGMKVTLVALFLGLLMCGYLAFSARKTGNEMEATGAEREPSRKTKS